MNAPATPCTTPEAIESWKPNSVTSQPPALQPQAASRIHTTEPRTWPEQVGREAHALDQRAGHDRAGRPAEQQERRPEDAGDVVRRGWGPCCRPRRASTCRRPRGRTSRRPGTRRSGRSGRAALHAAVDPPAQVVERGRDDGDRQNVLQRRRHHVLAAGDAGLVRHEAGMDQPHDDDGEEVELLGEHLRVGVTCSVSSSAVASTGITVPPQR